MFICISLCHVFGSYYLCFRVFTPMYFEPFVFISCVHISHIWVQDVDLVDISMPNPFALIVSCLFKPSHLKTSLLFILKVIVINHQKGGD